MAPETIPGHGAPGERHPIVVSRFHGVMALVLIAELIAIYWRAAHELHMNWTLVDSYYSHGFFVPLISLYFVWKERAAILRYAPIPSMWGCAWLAWAAFMLILGDFLGFRVFGQFSLIPMLVGVLLLHQGAARTKRMWFALAFLLFMIPIPPSLTQSIALQLKLAAARAAVHVANLLTLPMVQGGSFIHFGDDKLLVGEVCGGLRSLIALLAMGAIVACITGVKTWAKILILVLAGPVAVAANIMRIFFLCVVGYYWGSEIAAGKVHDYSGVLIFAVAMFLFSLIDLPLRKWARADETGSATQAQAKTTSGGRKPGAHLVVVAVVLVLVCAGHMAIVNAQSRAGHAVDTSPDIVIPREIVQYVQRGADDEIDPYVKKVLETSSILMRTYSAPNGRPIQLTIVYAGSTRRSLHFPEVCLVGGGWEIREQRSTQVGISFSARELVLVKNDNAQAVLYWFKTGDHLTGNYFLNALEWAGNQLTFSTPTSAMIKLTTPVGQSGEEAAFAALHDFAGKLAPELLKHVQ